MANSALREAVHETARDSVALEDAMRRVTFGELDALIEEEGEWLAAGGERFALLAGNGIGWAVTDLALHFRGLVTVPLPGYFTTQQLRHVIADAGIDCLLTDDPRRVLTLAGDWRRSGESTNTALTMFRRELDASVRRPLARSCSAVPR